MAAKARPVEIADGATEGEGAAELRWLGRGEVGHGCAPTVRGR